jgi:hypothetical protein
LGNARCKGIGGQLLGRSFKSTSVSENKEKSVSTSLAHSLALAGFRCSAPPSMLPRFQRDKTVAGGRSRALANSPAVIRRGRRREATPIHVEKTPVHVAAASIGISVFKRTTSRTVEARDNILRNDTSFIIHTAIAAPLREIPASKNAERTFQR